MKVNGSPVYFRPADREQRVLGCLHWLHHLLQGIMFTGRVSYRTSTEVLRTLAECAQLEAEISARREGR